jgi:hypothetical protein
MVASIPEFSLLFISMSMQFRSTCVVPKYLSFATSPKDLLSIFMLGYAFVLPSDNVTLTFSSFSLDSLPDQPPC